MFTKISTILVQMKPLRVALAIIAILVAAFAVDAGTKANYDGIQVLLTLVLPALTPLVFLVLLLDALMNRVWLIDAAGDDIAKYKTIMRIDLLLAAVIFIRWIPFFIEIWQ
jgi:hypothetical protein